MASVSHQGMTSPASLSPSRDRSRRRYRPIRCAGRRRRPRARATSGPSACELILLADDGLHRDATTALWRSTPFGSLARIFATAGKFFLKASTASIVLRVVDAAAPRSPRRSRAPSTRARPWSRRADDGERLRRATAPGPCAASARFAVGPPGPGRPQQPPPVRGAVIGVELPRVRPVTSHRPARPVRGR